MSPPLQFPEGPEVGLRPQREGDVSFGKAPQFPTEQVYGTADRVLAERDREEQRKVNERKRLARKGLTVALADMNNEFSASVFAEQGEDAERRAEAVARERVQRSRKNVEKFEGILGSEEARLIADENNVAATAREVAHVGREMEKLKRKTHQAYLKNMMDGAADLAGSLPLFEQSLIKVYQTAKEDSRETSGGGVEGEKLANMAGQAAVSRTILEGIQNQVKMGNYTQAKRVYDKLSKRLDPDDKQSALTALETGRGNMLGTSASDIAYKVLNSRIGREGSAAQKHEEIRRQIKAHPGISSEDRGKAERMVFENMNRYSSWAKEDETKRVNATLFGGYKMLDTVLDARPNASPKELDDMAMKYVEENGLGPMEYRKMQTYYSNRLKGENARSDPKTFNKLMNMYVKDPIAFRNVDILSYAEKLAPSDLKLFIGWQGMAAREKDERRNSIFNLGLNRYDSLINDFAIAKGLSYADRWEVRMALGRRLDAYERAYPDASKTEIDAFVRGTLNEYALREAKVPRTIFGLPIPFTSKTVTKPAKDLPTPEMEAKASPEEYKKIRKKLIEDSDRFSEDNPPSAEVIEAYWKRTQERRGIRVDSRGGAEGSF